MLNTYLLFTNSMAPVWFVKPTQTGRPSALVGPAVGITQYLVLQEEQLRSYSAPKATVCINLSAVVSRYIVPLHFVEQLVNLLYVFKVKRIFVYFSAKTRYK